MRFGINFLTDIRSCAGSCAYFSLRRSNARPYTQLIPAFTENVLHAGPRGLGWAVSAIGAGGLGGALVTAYFASASAGRVVAVRPAWSWPAACSRFPSCGRRGAMCRYFSYRRRDAGVPRRDQYADPDALSGKRSGPRICGLHDDRDRRRAGRFARRRVDRRDRRAARQMFALSGAISPSRSYRMVFKPKVSREPIENSVSNRIKKESPQYCGSHWQKKAAELNAAFFRRPVLRPCLARHLAR